MFWNAYQMMHQDHKTQIRCLKQKDHRLQLKVDLLNKLVDVLQKESKTNATGAYMLKVN